MWEGGKLFPGILDFLRKQDADILLLQEVHAGTDANLPDSYRSIDILNQALRYPYYDFAPAMLNTLPEGSVKSGNAIFSKLPIAQVHEPIFFADPYRERTESNPAEFATTPRNLQHITVRNGDTELNLFNLHGVWDLDGDNYSVQRQRMSDAIVAATAGQHNVVLAGDTNAKPTNKAMLALQPQLSSVFGTELTTTFNMRRKHNPGYATAAVDMMFVSPTVRIVSKQCPDVDISDHRPLVVTLKV
jgi:endonuclease/exonuclease/phosphatase family metal-dependent hydrolase